MKGQIGLELLEYFFRGLFEHTHGPATLELTISGDLSRPDVTGYVDIGGASRAGRARAARPRRQAHARRALGPRRAVRRASIRLTRVEVSTEHDKTARASGQLALDHWTPGAIEASIKGDISPRLFQWGLPEQVGDASGGIALDVHVGGVWSHPTWQGTATVKDVAFRARKLGGRDITLDGRHRRPLRTIDARHRLPAQTAARRPAAARSTGTINDDQRLDRIDGVVSIGEELSLRTSTSGSTAPTSRTRSRAGRSRFSPHGRARRQRQRPDAQGQHRHRRGALRAELRPRRHDLHGPSAPTRWPSRSGRASRCSRPCGSTCARSRRGSSSSRTTSPS